MSHYTVVYGKGKKVHESKIRLTTERKQAASKMSTQDQPLNVCKYGSSKLQWRDGVEMVWIRRTWVRRVWWSSAITIFIIITIFILQIMFILLI